MNDTPRRHTVTVVTDCYHLVSKVTTVTLSLPPSQRGSRQTSRRGSVSEGGGFFVFFIFFLNKSLNMDLHFLFSGARKSRRGSLDIYTAEYALKIGGGEKKGITAMEQKTAFHMKVRILIPYESWNIDLI